MNKNLNGYYLNKTGDRVKQLLDRQFIVPTLDSVPTTSTRTWQDGEYEVEFRIGELCRVKINDTYEFFRLYDIIDNVCIWRNINNVTVDMMHMYVSENGEMVLSYSDNSIMNDGYINEFGEIILEFYMQ